MLSGWFLIHRQGAQVITIFVQPASDCIDAFAADFWQSLNLRVIQIGDLFRRELFATEKTAECVALHRVKFGGLHCIVQQLREWTNDEGAVSMGKM